MNASDCPACKQPLERHEIEGHAVGWCRRCSILAASEAALEGLFETLNERGPGGRRLASLLPRATGTQYLGFVKQCPSCHAALHSLETWGWSVCEGCRTRYVPASEFPALADDPSLARQLPVSILGGRMTGVGARREKTASYLLGAISLVLSVVFFVYAYQHGGITITALLHDRYLTLEELSLWGALFCLVSGVGLVSRGMRARRGARVDMRDGVLERALDDDDDD